MAESLFEIAVEPGRCFVRVTWRGLWRVSTVAEYRDAAVEAGAKLVAGGCRPSEIRALVNARALGPQTQDVVTAYQVAFEGREAQVGRVATLATSALFQLQVKRVGLFGHRTFTDEAEALAWLFSPIDE